MENDKCTGRYRSRFCNGAQLLSALTVLASAYSIALIIPVSADSERQIFVRINQLGYRPLDPKSAVAFSREALPEKFNVIDAVTQQVVFEGATKRIAGQWGQFDHHAELDFSAWQELGKYSVRIGEATSLPFEISSFAYRELPNQLLD